MDDLVTYYPPPAGLPHSHYPYYQHAPPLQAEPPYPPVPHHYPPFPSYAQPPHPPPAPHDEVRTLFIAGLPEDVKPREIYNLFREFPGYESSHLRSPTESSLPFAFAVFSDQPSAVAAMHALNGMVFDLEKKATLYIDFAKSNSRSKRSRNDDGRYGSDKKFRGPAEYTGSTPDPGVGSVHMPSAYNMIGYPSTTQSHGSFDGRYANETTSIPKLSNSPAPHASQNACPTLFVANLGPTCTEQELIQVFSRYPGFLKLKMQSTYGSPVAFVDFQDTASSAGALHHLQGMILYSSVAGEGMRLEYAKSRMGMRRKQT